MKKKSTIKSLQTIADCTFGENVKLVGPHNLYGCHIGNDSFVGPFVEIQQDARVGINTTISSHTFICTGVDIGNECFIGHGVTFVNDKFDNNGNKEKTIIGNNVKIGSNATILPVNVGDNVIIGAGAVVTKNIKSGTTVAGNPAKVLRE